MTVVDQKALAVLVPDEALRHHITEAVERDSLASLKDFMSRQQLAYTIPRAPRNEHEAHNPKSRVGTDDYEDEDEVGHRN